MTTLIYLDVAQMAGSIRVCCRVQLQQDLGILPTHLALSPDGGFLAMAGVRHEVWPLVAMLCAESVP